MACDGTAAVEPGLDFRVGQLGAAGGAGEHVHDVGGGVVGGIHDHVAQRAAQLGRVGEAAVLHPAVGGGEVAELDHAGGVGGGVAAEAGALRARGIAQVHECERELGGEDFLLAEFFERDLRCAVHERLELRRDGERSRSRQAVRACA